MGDEKHRHCQETVFVRDTYRVNRRSKSGFSLHYREQQCGRFVRADQTHCWQHKQAAERRAVARVVS